MAGNNLKTIITADTAQFKKGVKDAQNALKDFSKQGESALSEVASMFGVNSNALSTFTSSISNATKLIAGLGREGDTALAGLKTAALGVGTALAGMGIAAAINLFKELNAEAAYFEQRMQGVNLAAGAKAARETYRDALMEASGRGEAWAKEWQTQRTVFSGIWADLRTLNLSPEERQDALAKSQEAYRLASERVDIQRRMDASVESQARFQKEINDQLLIARDRSKTSAERDAARAKAVEAINDKYDEQLSIATALRDNIAAMDALTDNKDEEDKQLHQANANLLNIESQRTQELTSMVRLENQISTSKTVQATAAEETQKATELTLEAATKLVEQQRALNALQTHNNAMMGRAREASLGWGRVSDPTLMLRALGANQATIKVPATIVPKVDGEAAEAAVLELSDIIADGVAGMSEALGGLIGDLINGENAWGNFAQAGISVVADMLSTVGKAFIAEGVGVIAAQKALTMGAGAGAVAAGAAMVALAATMKTAMSNAASSWGSGGYSSSVASSSYASSSAYGTSAFGREMELKVTGTLTANGSKLVAVLNNENDRRSYTT